MLQTMATRLWILIINHDNIASNASDASILTTLSDEFRGNLVDMMEDTNYSTSEYSRYARAKLRYLPKELEIEGTEVKAYPILLAMLDRAPSDHGQRYVACAIALCGHKTNPVQTGEHDVLELTVGARQEFLGLANDWLKLLLWPGMTFCIIFSCWYPISS